MKRVTLALAAALACLLVAAVGTASAMPTEGIVNTACSTTAKNVAGGKIQTRIAGKNVASSQMKYAECKIINRVAKKIAMKEIEKPTNVEGFRITPSVVSTTPDVVKYSGLWRGADTATEIKISFKITYANN